MNLYEVNHRSENDPRISLSRDSFRLLAHYGIKRALILFISENSFNYRLSLVTIDLKWEEGKRVKREYSNPRRYSFFLGPETKTHTPETYLIKKGRVKDFDDLKERFSLEIVNKDFYKQIAILFTKLAGGERTIGRTQFDEKGSLYLPSTTGDKIKKEFSVRLIGRLVFCWFLKKKCSDKGTPLLPEELLSSKAVIRKSDFYHNILEPLFFEILNTPIKERKKEYQIPPWSQIPFLNGGLFANEYNDYYEIDQLGISKYINTLKVPDSWLKELFEIFEIYNFTIDENTSVDVELSIEPEMLGRIFENLLAEINPETGNTARKATGSYYTPRPIVEYMVDESLKEYLLTKTNLDENKISSLLAYEEEEVDLSESEKDTVLDALDAIKIIDPACGSGAFPMGILQKMLLILQKIDPESKKWLNKKVSQIENTIVREEFQKKIEAENWNYVHKLGIIQSSIYGIDIQPIAVDISKLRFFLSLIIDEKVDDSKDNRGVDSLPNLEFKFVCANSLIGLPKKNSQTELFEIADNIRGLKRLREEYLRCYGDEKASIERKFQDIQNKMFMGSLEWLKCGGGDSQTVKLSQWNPFSGESCKWFDPEWMFGVKDGFDVVIANPPYLKERDNKNVFEPINNSYFGKKYHQGKMDFWYYFLHKAIDIVKNDGVISYITSRYWLNSSGAKKLIQRIAAELSFVHFIDIGKLKVFHAVAGQHMVATYKKTKVIDDFIYKKLENDVSDINKNSNTGNVVIKRLSNKKIFTENYEIILDSCYQKLSNTIPLGKISDISQGVVQNPDKVSKKASKKHKLIQGTGVFVLEEKEYKNLQPLSEEEKYFIRNFYDEKDIRKYLFIKKRKKYLLYLTKSNCPEITKYTRLREHLNKYKKIMQERRETKKGTILWFQLHWPREEKYFEREKIVIPSMFSEPTATLISEPAYFGLSTNLMIALDQNYDLRYLLSIINSKFALDWFYKNGKKRGGGVDIGVKKLRLFPVKIADKNEQKLFVEIVDKILTITKSGDYLENPEKQAQVKEYEKQIDQMVYKLYGLTDEEIKIVENFDSKK